MSVQPVQSEIYTRTQLETSYNNEETNTDESIFDKFTDWYNDNECTDNADNGKIGVDEFAEEYAKGLFCGIIDTAVEHPILTGLTIAGGVAATILTGGAIAPVLIGAGVLGSGISIGKGVYDYATAESDAEAKMLQDKWVQAQPVYFFRYLEQNQH